jgi:glycosyltransferase involved in cell wall biosynthesis
MLQMTRVLHVYSGNRFGGIEVLLVELQKRRADAPGIDSRFVLCFEGRLAQKLRAAGAQVSVFREVRFSRPWTVWRARSALREHLRQQPVDAVVCHEFWAYALAAPVVRSAGLPLLSWHHSPASGYRLEKAIRRFPPTLALTCSRFVADNLNGLVPAGRIRVCYAPVEPPTPQLADARGALRRSLGTADDETVILHVGRLSDYKGQVELLQAAQLLGDLRFRVWFVGDSQTAAEAAFLETLRSFVREHRMEQKVTFVGHSDNVYEHYGAADIYCQPNRKPEPYGFTFIEALYAGLPVIASDSGGSAEILRDEKTGQRYGLLVRPGDSQAVAAALRRLIDDPIQREGFRGKARRRAQSLGDPERAMARLHTLIDEAMTLGRNGAR